MSSEALCKEESEILTLQGPTMSKLLGGAKLREIRLTPSGNNESLVCTGDDSGILEISPDVPYTDDTTSVDDGSNRKVKRTARKCKWCDNFSRGSTNLYATCLYPSTKFDVDARGTEEEEDAIVANSPEALVTCA